MLYKVTVVPLERVPLSVSITATGFDGTFRWIGRWLILRRFLQLHFAGAPQHIGFDAVEADLQKGIECIFEIDAAESLMHLAHFEPVTKPNGRANPRE